MGDGRNASPSMRRDVQWAVFADDLTGALDTGIKFAQRGASVRVLVDGAAARMPEHDDNAVDVWVINTLTRHCSPRDAYQRVADWTRAFRGVVRRFYLKTDSTLRGNPGAEIAALMDGSGARIACFAPAYPDTGRTTTNGVQYLGGVPIHETEVARDPKNPIPCSHVGEVLRLGYRGPIHLVPTGDEMPADAAGVYVFDARTNADLARIADGLRGREDARIYAGCAGFARVIPLDAARNAPCVPLERERDANRARIAPPCFILSGSVHPRTLAQIRRAREAGVACVGLSPAEMRGGAVDGSVTKCRETLARGGSVILASALSEADRIDLRGDRAHRGLQEALARCWMAIPEGTARMVIGGDTLQAVMKALGETAMEPIAEPLPGLVLSRIKGGSILTRSGGFGREEDLMRLCAGELWVAV